MVSDGHALSRLDICKAALPNKVYSGSSIPNFTGGNKSEVNTADGHLIDGKRYNVEKIKIKIFKFLKIKIFCEIFRYNVEKITSRLQWTANFANLSTFMEIDYANEMNVPLLFTEQRRALELSLTTLTKL